MSNFKEYYILASISKKDLFHHNYFFKFYKLVAQINKLWKHMKKERLK